MSLDEPRYEFDHEGFAVLAGYLSHDELHPALSELALVFPSPDEFHDDTDPVRNERFRDEFGGISTFPFASVELSLLAVHHRLVELAEGLLGTRDLRVYSIEAWAKYSGAARYEQSHHRDYLNHSLLAPSVHQRPAQVEMFLYLTDVPPGLGPPSYVPLEHTQTMDALPNWLPAQAGATDSEHPTWISSDAWPALYDHEISATGPAGTVAAYRIETFHRATELTTPRAARYTLHVSLRRTDSDWIGRRAWSDDVNSAGWRRFVARASVRQLQLFGFPPPGHPYWSDETLAGVELRYPGFVSEPWRSHPSDP